MSGRNRITTICAIAFALVAAPIGLRAHRQPSALDRPVFTTLFTFDYTDGSYPLAGLVQAADGNLYGATTQTSSGNSGTIFRITPLGILTNLSNLSNGVEGAEANTLIQATDGSLYGTARNGGANTNGMECPNGCGTVFRMTTGGKVTTLYNFCETLSNGVCADGSSPDAGLVETTDGNLYGTTTYGGSATCYDGCGTVFRITRSGVLTTLYSFCSQPNCTDGNSPGVGPLLQATNGILYGTTSIGGTHSENCGGAGCGTVYRISPAGRFTSLYSFCSQSGCPDGDGPVAGLIQATNGQLYGTTDGGGSSNCPNGCETVFTITLGGQVTTLHTFDNADGFSPHALVQGSDGNFYGTTDRGGSNDNCSDGTTCGTIFKMTPDGTLTTLHDFDPSGYYPFAGLTQDTDGAFYGTTNQGGDSMITYGCCGTVFRISVGLGPFVETNPAAGNVGANVGILGTNLNGATGVKFNGTETAFRVVSSSFIEAKVPSGATTGTVTVQLPGGTLSSNVPFIVLP